MENKNLYTVVIGSSAGGLDALLNFCSGLDKKAHGTTAFIIAQHLSPNFQSHLAELLGKDCNLPVVQAVDNQMLEPGNIYVSPPEKDIYLEEDFIRLSSPASIHKPSINRLFMSASLRGSEVIGIILSGTGSDGAQGIISLKDAGAMTLVQNPKHAEYDGMPIAAINTRKVDAVLGVLQMPAAVAHYSRFGNIDSILQDETIFRDTPEEKILKILERYTGTELSNYKTSTISRRMERRMFQLKLSNAYQYLDYIEKNSGEISLLYQNFLIGVTSFFRDKESFAFLRDVLAEKVKGLNKIRIWVAGCANGEEAYTIAMILSELLKNRPDTWSVQIFATDIDESALSVARKGIYDADSFKNVEGYLVDRYFHKRDNKYEARKSLRSLVIFSKHDLTNNPPFFKLDLISCRNLFIYFNNTLQEKIMNLFHYSLNDDGLLFMGRSESIGKKRLLFLVVSSVHKLYRKNNLYTRKFPAAQSNVFPIPTAANAGTRDLVIFEDNPLADISNFGAMQNLLKDNFYRNYQHPFVIVDQSLNVVHINGQVSPFIALREGYASLNIISNSHDELKLEMQAVLTNAVTSQQKVTGFVKKIAYQSAEMYLKISAWPLQDSKENEMFIVAFEKVNPDDFPADLQFTFIGEGLHEQKRILELERELAETRQHLQSFVEKLGVANEQLQAANEELQSTNEELQTSNEELEASNEELQGTGQEMVVAYTELKEVHRLLEEKEAMLMSTSNKFETVLDNATQSYVLIDSQYRVLTFNKEARQMFLLIGERNLAEGENILTFIPGVLLQRFKEHLDSAWKGEIHSKLEAECINNLWVQFSYIPVFGIDKSVENVLISQIDLTEKTLSQKKIEASEHLFRAIIENNEDLLIRQDEDQNILYLSPSLQVLTGYSSDELMGSYLRSIIWEQDVVLFDEALDEAMRIPNKLITSTVRVKHKSRHVIWMEMRAVNMLSAPGIESMIVRLRDVTFRMEYEIEREKIASDLVQRNKNHEQFTYVISHNLRAPLANIIGFTEQLKDQNLDIEDRAIFLDELDISVNKLDMIIRDLNHILQARKDVGEISEQVSFSGILDDVKLSLKKVIDAEGVSIRADFSELDQIFSTKSYIYSIFYNLISNSIKYRKQNVASEIRIFSKKLTNSYQLVFNDNGLGIDIDKKGNQVFGLYKRFHTQSGIEGKGLGLYMTKTQVELLGGKISVTSKVDEGAEFVIEFPL